MHGKLTKEESLAIKTLQRLSMRWPKSLWLWSANGRLCVMRKKDGQRMMTENGGVDPSFWVCSIEIENDGGDW